MKKMYKFLALGLAVVMSLSLIACGDNGNSNVQETGGGGTTTTTDGGSGGEVSTGSGKLDKPVNIGMWWIPFYDSSHTSVEDDPTYSGLDIAHRKFDNVKVLEERYGVPFYFHNLTSTGTNESLTTSVLAGTPDMEVYLVGTEFGIPAVTNGLAIDLRTILPADHDLFTSQTVVRYLDLNDGKVSLFTRTSAESQVENTYVLGYNKQLLEANNLEDPNALWARGEWTWDKFIEYCQVLTQDTTGDGQMDQYGYSGYFAETLAELLMSNGTYIAGNANENLSSNEVGETLQMMYDMYNTYNICYPYDFNSVPNDYSTTRWEYRRGNVGFFPITQWILNNNDDYYPVGADTNLNFDIVFARWPVGPSGNAATNAGKRDVAGEWYILPAGVANPELVFNYFYDYLNWYDFDVDVRDDKENLHWWYQTTAFDLAQQEFNFSVTRDACSIGSFDLWEGMGIENFQASIMELFKGNMTPAQVQETHKNQFQEALSAIFK